MTPAKSAIVWFVVAALTPMLRADDVKYYDEGGYTYRETRVHRVVPETRYESHDITQYRPKVTTDYQDVQRTYQVPVTQQQWVPGYQRSWNVFAPPVLSYRLLPVTRWETRSETVRVPVTRTEYLPEKQTQQVPVTSQRLLEDVHKVCIGPTSTNSPSGGASNVASGGTKLQSDPPREGNSVWRTADETGARRQ